MESKLYNGDYLKRLHSRFSPTKKRSYDLLNIAPGDIIADVGCGIGLDSIYLARAGAKVFGIDNDPGFIAFANEQLNASLDVDFLICDACCIPLPDHAVDKIRFDRVMQHSADHDQILREASRILRPNGIIQIIDTDYLSISLFLEDYELEKQIVYAIAHERIPNGHKTRQLRSELMQKGFKLISHEINNYTIADYDEARSIIKFDNVIDDLCQSGRISGMQYDAWISKDKAHFTLSLNLMILTALKPTTSNPSN
nr:methyltransferase domain-containing protein [uncultured Dyadobacter sp.]